MSYLLDTNIISETIKNNPNKNVIEWLKNISGNSLFVSVISLGEIRKSIEKLDSEKKKSKLIPWLENELATWFEDRILPIDIKIADKWGHINGKSSKSLGAIDSLIAATALTYNLKLVTRNIKDFEDHEGLEIINPF